MQPASNTDPASLSAALTLNTTAPKRLIDFLALRFLRLQDGFQQQRAH